MKKDLHSPIHIIGAGISGLTLAYFLEKVGFTNITIFEKSDRSGGIIHSCQKELGLVETAANGLLLTKTIADILKDIKLVPLSPNKKSKKRFIYHNHKFTRLPILITSIPWLIIGIIRLSLFKKLWKPKNSETVYEYSSRLFNKDIAQNLVCPGLQGIYGEDGSQLSAKLIFGKYTSSKKREHSLGLVSFENGMQEFTDTLTTYLCDKGVKIKYGTDMTVDKDTTTILATSLKSLEFLYPKAWNIFKDVKYQSISTTTLFHNDNKPIQGFGVLINKRHSYKTMGILFNDHIFSNRTKSTKDISETWIRSNSGQDKSEIEKDLLFEREKMFGHKIYEKKALFTTVWKAPFPRYDSHLEKAINEFKQHQFGNVFFTGNYLGEIGISGIIAYNKELAYDIRKQ